MKATIKIVELSLGPQIVNVPNWVNWMATDKSGSLWFYQHKPVQSSKYAAWHEPSNRGISRSLFAGEIKPPKDYTQELYTWC